LTGEQFQYGFKGARSAPDPGWPPYMQERRTPQTLTVDWRGIRPQLAGRQGTVTLRAPAAFLWPLRATSAPSRNSTPRPTAWAARRNASGSALTARGAIPAAPAF